MKRILHAMAMLCLVGRLLAFGNQLSASLRKYKRKLQNSNKPTVKIGGKALGTDFHVCRTLCSAPHLRGLAMVFACIGMFGPLLAQAQSTDTPNSKPLQIGDTIPEALWHLPLQVVNHPDGRDTITLNDYRGKLILLDFWSTGCSGCIKALPTLEIIQSEFADDVIVLPITREKRSRVSTFVPKNKYLHNIRLPFIVEDTLLKQYFPHQYVSHVVWIDGNGIVRATTGTNHIVARTIRELQSGKQLDWPVKTENTSFFREPLVTLLPQANQLPNNAARPLYYSVITGYTEGIGQYAMTKQDSLLGIERISYRNGPILDLYLSAVNMLYRIKSHQVIWEVDSPAMYSPAMADLTAMTEAQWYQRHAICYERTVPRGTSEKEKKEYILLDLNNLLNLNGRLEVRNGETFFILSQRN